jgi:hypothetical protein
MGGLESRFWLIQRPQITDAVEDQQDEARIIGVRQAG